MDIMELGAIGELVGGRQADRRDAEFADPGQDPLVEEAPERQPHHDEKERTGREVAPVIEEPATVGQRSEPTDDESAEEHRSDHPEHPDRGRRRQPPGHHPPHAEEGARGSKCEEEDVVAHAPSCSRRDG